MCMQIPVENWYPAIGVRRSRRAYSSEKPSQKILERINSVCFDFRPFPEARAEFILEPGKDFFRGIVGSYGRIENAPVCVAFIGDMNSARVQEAVGFTGEGIILEATTLGLGSCWVGGFFRPGAIRERISIQESERVLAVTPLGIAPDMFTFQEKLMAGFGHMHRRKPLKNMVDHVPTKKWQRIALEAARLAPSAVNRQPWRFSLTEQAIAIGLDAGHDSYKIARRLDCGIAMLHLELGARHAGIKGNWSFPPGQVACYQESDIH